MGEDDRKWKGEAFRWTKGVSRKVKAKIPLCWALRTSPGSTKRGKDGENRKQVSKGKREGVREKNKKQVQWPHEH